MNIPIPPHILDNMVPTRLFARLSIASKMLLGYMTLVALTIVVVVYALINLERINTLNRSIVQVDILVGDTTDKMLDALLAQDTYEKRYLILKSRDIRNLFAKRGSEFTVLLSTLKNVPSAADYPLKSIEVLHTQYTGMFTQELQLMQSGRKTQAQVISNNQMKRVLEKLIETLKTMSASAREAQDAKMQNIRAIGGAAFFMTSVLCLISIVAGALAGLIVTHHISSTIHKLKVATERIAEGNFDYDPQIKTKDEIGMLSEAFLAMGKRLRKLEEMYLDASPLTRLPGGIAIENVLKKRIDAHQPLALCVLDLDNFKAFNDRYGYANGSEIIKETGKLIEAAVKATGTPDDFIGHVGGDDFVVITTPAVMRDLAADVIARFDQRIPEFYDPIDRKRGSILGKTRQGVEMQFPIMTISIAIVTNQHREFSNPLEASEIAAELKDYAKTIPRSVFVVDKRRVS